MFIITNGDGWYLGQTRLNEETGEQETDLTTTESKARQFATEQEANHECKASGLINDGYYVEEL